MSLTADLRLPGIYFLPPPTQAAPGLPPLDVAAFVGFAARGPLNLPVALEDAAMYAAIFGGDLALANEPGGAVVWANLPTAVNQFFANGGRRCYVVRVAGPEADRSHFPLPGVVAMSKFGLPRQAGVYAAWQGRWSTAVQLASRAQHTPLNAADFSTIGVGQLDWQPDGASDSLKPGDVLRLQTGGETWLAPIDSLVTADNGFSLTLSRAWRILESVTVSPPLAPTSAVRLTFEGSEALALDIISLADAPDEVGQISLVVSGAGTESLAVGDILWLSTGADEGYLFPIKSMEAQPETSPPEKPVMLLADQMLQLPSTTLPAGPLEEVVRLRFDLLSRAEARRYPTINDLAFNGGHPRFWGQLAYLASSPLHQDSAAPDNGRRAEEASRFYEALQGEERLPDEEKIIPDTAAFGALFAPLTKAETEQTFLPLGMLDLITDGDYTAVEHEGSDDLATFKLDNFFDQALVSSAGRVSAATLHSATFDRLFIQGKRLRGLHSLYFTDEVALVSLPDAVHRTWQAAPPPAPAEVTPFEPLPYDGSQFLYCQAPPLVSQVQPAQGTTLGGTLVTISGLRFTESEQTGVLFNGNPAGSVIVLDENTLSCIAPPSVTAGPVTITVTNWFGAGSKADAFIYFEPVEATLPLLDPEAAYDEGLLRKAQSNLISFCQSRRDVVAILSLPAHYLPQACLAWQDNLRRDFGLPPWGYSRNDQVDLPDLSYAAVYHPWLLVTDASGSLRPVPADGVACGQIALRERRRQVWVAPANQPIQGVLGLHQTFGPDDRLALFNRNINLTGREVGVFRLISAHTLSSDRQWQQLSVRRLLILLRKIVHERGMDYVFESNDERFRSGVQFALEELLLGMYVRGAFSGASAQQAFRVSTGPDINPPQSVRLGRFIAQIQVAPSQPLEFITILLLREGDGTVQAVETA